MKSLLGVRDVISAQALVAALLSQPVQRPEHITLAQRGSVILCSFFISELATHFFIRNCCHPSCLTYILFLDEIKRRLSFFGRVS